MRQQQRGNNGWDLQWAVVVGWTLLLLFIDWVLVFGLHGSLPDCCWLFIERLVIVIIGRLLLLIGIYYALYYQWQTLGFAEPRLLLLLQLIALWLLLDCQPQSFWPDQLLAKTVFPSRQRLVIAQPHWLPGIAPVEYCLVAWLPHHPPDILYDLVPDLMTPLTGRLVPKRTPLTFLLLWALYYGPPPHYPLTTGWLIGSVGHYLPFETTAPGLLLDTWRWWAVPQYWWNPSYCPCSFPQTVTHSCCCGPPPFYYYQFISNLQTVPIPIVVSILFPFILISHLLFYWCAYWLPSSPSLGCGLQAVGWDCVFVVGSSQVIARRLHYTLTGWYPFVDLLLRTLLNPNCCPHIDYLPIIITRTVAGYPMYSDPRQTPDGVGIDIEHCWYCWDRFVLLI